MKTETTSLTGRYAEDEVIRILNGKGYRFLCRNYAVHNVGEIDSAFLRDDTLYVIEVRARKIRPGYPTPSESVTFSKRQKIIKTARYLINSYGLGEIDIVFLIGQVVLNDAGLVQNVEFVPF